MTKFVQPVFFFLLVVTIWQSVVKLGVVSAVILPSPGETALALADNAQFFLDNASYTALNAVLGLSIAFFLSFLLCVLFFYSDLFRNSFYPFAISLKATPLVAIAPIIVLAFGSGASSKIAMAAIVAFFPIMVSFWDGIARINLSMKDAFRLYGATKTQTFFVLMLPAAIPDLISGVKIASTLAVVGAIIAEFVGSNAGLGYVIKTGSYYLDMDMVYAAIICTALVSLSMFGIVAYIERIAERRLNYLR